MPEEQIKQIKLLPSGAVVHTSKGEVWLRLYPEQCPNTVENFTTHAKNGFYDNLIFHRVVKVKKKGQEKKD